MEPVKPLDYQRYNKRQQPSFTAEQVYAIRQEASEHIEKTGCKAPVAILAGKYNVSLQTIRNVIYGKGVYKDI